MNELRQLLTGALAENREQITARMLEALAQNAEARRLTDGPEEYAQAIRGFLSLLSEGLVGEKTTIREYWLETLFPGLIQRGQTTPEIMRTGTRITTEITYLLTLSLPETERWSATSWLAEFFGDVNRDVVRVCFEAERSK